VSRNGSLVEALIIGDNATGFSACHILVCLKAEDSNVSEGADRLTSDRAAYTLRAILYQKSS